MYSVLPQLTALPLVPASQLMATYSSFYATFYATTT